MLLLNRLGMGTFVAKLTRSFPIAIAIPFSTSSSFLLIELIERDCPICLAPDPVYPIPFCRDIMLISNIILVISSQAKGGQGAMQDSSFSRI